MESGVLFIAYENCKGTWHYEYLQVVIGLCKRKETAALKIKAAVSNGRVNLSAGRRLFFFCRRPAEWFSYYC